MTGGRFNRRGQKTLYLALDIVTAVNECAQGLSNRIQPLTICEYEVDCDDVADLREQSGRQRHNVELEDLSCSWLALSYTANEPPSRGIVDRLLAEGYVGILVPSFAPGAKNTDYNLVLWAWSNTLPHKVTVYDPSGRLPQNQLSWPAK